MTGIRVALLALMSAATTVFADQSAAMRVLDAELEAIVTNPERPLASLSVLAIRNGRVVYERQFGRRFIDDADPARSKPANAETLYRIASISKLVTALGVMRLVEQKKLSLDTDISDYLGYRVRNPHFADVPVTLRMLLTHTASLRDDADYVFPAGTEIREFLVPGGKLYGTGAMWSSKAGPGEYFTYCNLNSAVIGTVMEKVTGERFDRLMKRLVLEPLGMRGGFNPAEMPDQVGNIAAIYRKATAGDTQAWDPKGPWIAQVDDYSAKAPVNRAGADYVIGSNGGLQGPQGGLRASAADLGRVMRMLMNRGTLDGKRFLDSRTIDVMLTRNWKSNGGANGESWRESMQAWGIGNQQFVDMSGPGTGDRLVEGGGFTGVGHLGDAYGLHGVFAFDPATRNGMIILAGGTGFDPETDRGQYSALRHYEERILTALYRRAVQGKAEP